MFKKMAFLLAGTVALFAAGCDQGENNFTSGTGVAISSGVESSDAWVQLTSDSSKTNQLTKGAI